MKYLLSQKAGWLARVDRRLSSRMWDHVAVLDPYKSRVLESRRNWFGWERIVESPLPEWLGDRAQECAGLVLYRFVKPLGVEGVREASELLSYYVGGSLRPGAFAAAIALDLGRPLSMGGYLTVRPDTVANSRETERDKFGEAILRGQLRAEVEKRRRHRELELLAKGKGV